MAPLRERALRVKHQPRCADTPALRPLPHPRRSRLSAELRAPTAAPPGRGLSGGGRGGVGGRGSCRARSGAGPGLQPAEAALLRSPRSRFIAPDQAGAAASAPRGELPPVRAHAHTHTHGRGQTRRSHTHSHTAASPPVPTDSARSASCTLPPGTRSPAPTPSPPPPEHRSPAARCRPVPLGHLSPCGRAPGEHPLPLPPAHPHGREAASGRREWGGREAGGAAGRRRPQAARGGSGTCWPPHRTARSGPRGRSTHARSRPAAAERQQPQPAPGGSSYPSPPSSPQALAVPPPRMGMGGGRQPHVCPTCWLHSPELQQHHRTSLTAKSSGGTPWGPQFSACTQC